jgi:hypothetical protein
VAVFTPPSLPAAQENGRTPRRLTGRISTTVVWTAAASVVVVLGILAALSVLWHLRRIVVLLLVAGFFAVVLSPAVDAVGQRLRLRRALSVAVVFLVGMLVAAAWHPCSWFPRSKAYGALCATHRPSLATQSRATGQSPASPAD